MVKETPSSVIVNPKRKIPHVAYQMEEINGGYQLYRIRLDDDRKIVSRDKVSAPDAWDQIILLLEAELSKQFQ